MEDEIWKEIKGYEGCYKISNKGNVFSIKNNKNLVLVKNTTKYYQVFLCKNGVRQIKKVHQLVVEAFIDSDYKFKKLVIDHIDRNRNNNNLNNLRVVSVRKNNSYDRGRNLPTGVIIMGNKYRASICNNSFTYNLGTYNTVEEAEKVYLKALSEIENGCFVNNYKRKTTSQYKNVSFCKKINRWKAKIVINKKEKFIGLYKNEYEAHLAVLDYKKNNNLDKDGLYSPRTGFVIVNNNNNE